MTKPNVGQLISALANVGVLLGILLLVYELNQNTAAMQGDTYQGLLDSVTSVALTVAQDAELSRIVSVGNIQPSDLRAEDWSRYVNFKLAQVWQFQYAYLAYERTEMNELQWSAIAPAFASLACQPGFQKFWSELGPTTFAVSFQEYVLDASTRCLRE